MSNFIPSVNKRKNDFIYAESFRIRADNTDRSLCVSRTILKDSTTIRMHTYTHARVLFRSSNNHAMFLSFSTFFVSSISLGSCDHAYCKARFIIAKRNKRIRFARIRSLSLLYLIFFLLYYRYYFTPTYLPI